MSQFGDEPVGGATAPRRLPGLAPWETKLAGCKTLGTCQAILHRALGVRAQLEVQCEDHVWQLRRATDVGKRSRLAEGAAGRRATHGPV